MVVHLGGEVLCVGLLLAMRNTEDTTALLPLGHPSGECSSLWREELQAGLLDSKEALSLCMLHEALLSTPLVRLVHAWKEENKRKVVSRKGLASL